LRKKSQVIEQDRLSKRALLQPQHVTNLEILQDFEKSLEINDPEILITNVDED
jgi:hypothetical protein